MLKELSHMDRITQLQDEIEQLLTIMSNSLVYLTSRSNFLQVSSAVPVTKSRNPEKYDATEIFEGNKQELVIDLIAKAKQVEYLIQSLPQPEAEEEQANRLQRLQEEMSVADAEYAGALKRTKNLHAQVSEVLKTMLSDSHSAVL
ncbi:hypothetical protein IW261DRAFT_1343733 [Armillaria novae-zelandiae]|uniref:Mediator of RNA polymerase II transcription subunit 21 n=1 Tax=Armillaria novae-zelandiae TaxID=153914 RepID=A0AA39NVD0_9AGAR|nr:hypothetical protein IW261DRAFT_1343733 [Armillaria novae-zelandiae]